MIGWRARIGIIQPEVVVSLENDLGKPVVTDHQATMWHTLKAGMSDSLGGVGRLLSHKGE